MGAGSADIVHKMDCRMNDYCPCNPSYLHYRKQKAHFRFGVIVMLWTFGLSAWTLYYLLFYVKAENTRDFSRGMNRLIFRKVKQNTLKTYVLFVKIIV